MRGGAASPEVLPLKELCCIRWAFALPASAELDIIVAAAMMSILKGVESMPGALGCCARLGT